MPEISINAMTNVGGPHVPSKHSAWISEEPWPGGGTVSVLKMQIGDCGLSVFPADPDHILDFAKQLAEIGIKLGASQEKVEEVARQLAVHAQKEQV